MQKNDKKKIKNEKSNENKKKVMKIKITIIRIITSKGSKRILITFEIIQ